MSLLSSLGSAITPGFGSALGGIAGAVGNVIATNQTNKANRAMFDEQLAYNREQWNNQVAENRYLTQQARDWQLQDIESEREYNSPVAQMQRWREAGLNPYLMADQTNNGSVETGSAPQGSAPSAAGAPSAPVMQTPDVASSFGQSVQALLAFQQQKNNNDIAATDVAAKRAQMVRDNENHIIDYQQKLEDLNHSKENNPVMRRYYEMMSNSYALQNRFLSSSMADRLLNVKKQNEVMDAQVRGIDSEIRLRDMQTKAQEIANQYAPSLNEANLNKLHAETQSLVHGLALIDANVSLTREQKINESVKYLEQRQKAAMFVMLSPSKRKEFYRDLKSMTLNALKSQSWSSTVDATPLGFGVNQFSGFLGKFAAPASRLMNSAAAYRLAF